MKKTAIFLLGAMLLASTVSAAGSKATLPAFDVSLNGVVTESGNRQFPLIVYKDITYVPMTYYDCRFLGLVTEWNNETGTLSIEKGNISAAYRDYAWEWKNPKNVDVQICKFNIIVNGREIDNSGEEYPLLLFRDVTYFPLTWRFAAEEFGWDYHFDAKNGLSIASDNCPAVPVDLECATGNAATDGEYYYYNGQKDGVPVIYRAPVADTKNISVIHTLPDTFLSQSGASFTESEGDVYFSYYAGSSPIMGSRYSYKINKDGTVEEKTPDEYSYAKHGYSQILARGDGIEVKGVNEYFDSATKFFVKKNGEETEIPALPGRIRAGQIQIFGEKVYYHGDDLDQGSESALYCIDTNTMTAEKLIDGANGFYVYKGWLNRENADSIMIIYDNGDKLMRYSETDGEIRDIDERSDNEGLILKAATGGYMIYTIQQTVGGDRTVVKRFDCYADGTGSINGDVILDTEVGTNIVKMSDKICACVMGETENEDIRTVVMGSGEPYLSSDVAEGVFIYDNILMYRTGGKIVKAVLK